MRFVIFWVLLLLTHTTQVFCQDTLQHRIVLVGDAGLLHKGRHPVVDAVRKTIPLDAKTSIVYLGDNLYKTGLPDDQLPTYQTAKAVLDTQISIVDGTNARLFFIPGNHDWADGGVNGLESIRRQQYYVEVIGNRHDNKNIQYLPRDGCPGPVEVNLTNDVVLVIFDSQWWLHEYTKPGIESDCAFKTKNEVLTQFKDILDRNFRKLVLFATHHPFRTYGSHGSYYTWKQHLFPLTEIKKKLYIPLPVLGSVYPLVRGVFGTTQDLKHPSYQEMINEFEKVIKGHPNVILAGGHEHSLQYIVDSNRTYIVSGSAAKAYRVSKPKNSLYAKSEYGFATVDVHKNKTVTTHFYTVDYETGEIKKDFSHNTLDFSKLPPEPAMDTARVVEADFGDSVLISVSDKYKNPSGFRRFVLGNNYRETWSKAIKLKVLNLKKEKGGLIPVSVGGGKQTKALTLRDQKGRFWTLRSLDKDPEKAIPEYLRGTLAQDIVQDMISAGHPYAPLVVSELAKRTGVFQADPRIYYVPDDPALGFYRKMFAKTVCLLEEKGPLTGNADDTRSTNKVISKLLEDPDHRADQQAFLRARLLDMAIADWDRHADQWRWDILDTGKGKLYYPVPRDRDQAFFNSEGLLMKYIRKNKLRFLQGFRSNIADIRWLNHAARDLDRFFLNRLDDKVWSSTINSFVRDLSDSTIEAAVKKLPPEIYPIDGATIERRLKNRRDILAEEAMVYFKYLAKRVNITGSNEREYFKVSQNGDSLRIKVFKRTKTSDSAALLYDRSFSRSITKEIRVYGLNGNDLFDIDDAVDSRIKIRMIGGRGNDTFNVRGAIRNRLYDLNTENNYVINTRGSKVRFSDEIGVNEYTPHGFTYDEERFPRVLFGFNPEDKLLVGVGFSRINYGFRKQPYGSENFVSVLYALNRSAYQLKYNGTFNNVLGHSDFLVNAELVNPVLNNFFGMGNNTERDKARGPEFYRVRYKYTQGSIQLRRRLNDYLSATIGPMIYRYWNDFEDNKTRILGNPARIGMDSMSVYSTKTYIGGKAGFHVNFVNNEIFPTRGIIWNSELQALAGANKSANTLVKAYSDMMIPIPVIGPSKLYMIFKTGGGHIFSKSYEYFQAFNLGANNYMRGFRKNRFHGSSMFYTNLDMRVKLFQSNSYILPGDVGITGFFDLGKVWLKNVKDEKWHNSYGGGVYFTPFNLFVVSAMMGFSKEDQLFNISIGTKFNLTF